MAEGARLTIGTPAFRNLAVYNQVVSLGCQGGMDNQQRPRITSARRPIFGLRAIVSVLVAPLAICALGLIFLALALTQDAWVSGRIGPGLFAQSLSLGIVALAVIWAGSRVVDLSRLLQGGETCMDAEPVHLGPRIHHGLALLVAVCLFAILLPFVGLVVACAITAAVAGWGAGDRGLIALSISAVLGAGVAAGIGFTLLPPTIQLWPWGPF